MVSNAFHMDNMSVCYGLNGIYSIDILSFFECIGGRNRKVSEAFVTSGKSIEQLETEMLNGQKLQGPPTAKEVNFMLAAKKLESKWVFFFGLCHILPIFSVTHL